MINFLLFPKYITLYIVNLLICKYVILDSVFIYQKKISNFLKIALQNLVLFIFYSTTFMYLTRFFFVYFYFLDVIFVLPGRKHPRIEVDGFEYNVHKTKAHKTRWRCMNESKTKCTSVVYTFGNTVIVKKAHNHEQKNTTDTSKVGVPKYVKIVREILMNQ